MIKSIFIFFLFVSSFLAMAQDQESNFVTEEELSEIFNPIDPAIIPSDMIIVVDKAQKGRSDTAQKMVVYKRKTNTDKLDYESLFEFTVSTGSQILKKPKGRSAYYAGTPIGAHRISLHPSGAPKMHELYKSTLWGNAPMPYTMFFNGGIAIHGTTKEHFKELGTRDSGGCVRIHPDNAKVLYKYIQKNLKLTTATTYRRGGQPLTSKSGKISTQKNYNVLIVVINRDKERPLDRP